jgi:hypothetical protein
MNKIGNLMLGRRVLRLSLLSILWVGLAAAIGFHSIRLHAACSPQIGYGTNAQCVAGDSCGEICGVTTAWCITETCSQNLKCAGADQYVGCNAGGCLNGVTGNCTACGS